MDPEKNKVLKGLGGKLVNLAPYIAGLLGGPAAGAGAKILKDFLKPSKNEDIKDEDIEDLIAVLPIEKILELKKLDAELKATEAAVTMNAEDNLTRRLESDNLTDSQFVKHIRPGLAAFWSLVTAAVIALGLYATSPERIDFYNAALFATTAIMGSIIGFYFGGRSVEKIARIKEGQ
jgi:hypothetical protein